MRFWGSIAILFLIVALAYYFYLGHAESVVVEKLGVEALFKAIGIPINETLRADIAAYSDMFAQQGFMTLYRECYTTALDSQRFDFDRQFAAVSSLLVISRYELDSETLRASAQRLFINFCRLSLAEKSSAVHLDQLVEVYGLFSDNQELSILWDQYLQHVWLNDVRPRIRRYGRIDDGDRKFINLRGHFAAEASALMSRLGKSLD